jgi:hypothetical protein
MRDLCRLILYALIGVFRSRAVLEAENLVLRYQLNVLRRKSPKRLVFGNIDRLAFMGLYRLAPGVLDALKILKPQTVIRWHRAGFRAYWRWKSRPRGGRPRAGRPFCATMPTALRRWICSSSRRSRFGCCMDFLILQHSRRQLLWLVVTARPSAHWIARQLTEAYGWQQTPRYIVRDRDCVYGNVVIQRLRAMGIRDRPISPRSPWQNGYLERLIGSNPTGLS